MEGLPAPSAERVSEIFLALARIPSPSRSERGVAEWVVSFLDGLSLEPREDDAGDAVGGDCGNILCRVGGGSGRPHVTVSGHLDTVALSGDLDAFLDSGGIFRNRQDCILGADDKAAVAALLHATELLVGSGQEFPPFDLILTVCEEDGLLGAKHLGEWAVASPMAAVFDASGPVGGIVVRAPSRKALTASFRGRAAHAGMEPELGRSAIVAAGRAVAAMALGRLDEFTTANIGLIRGGAATNIIPDVCTIEGECRGHDEDRLAQVAADMVDAVQGAAGEMGVDVDVQLESEFRAFVLPEDSPVLRLAKAAVAAVGLEPSLAVAGGGSDANVLNARGIPTVNFQTGMMRPHSGDEYVSLDSLVRLCELALSVVVMAPRYGAGSDCGENTP